MRRARGSAARVRQCRAERGRCAIPRFLAVLETLETDLWQQYNELGGVRTAKSQVMKEPGIHRRPEGARRDMAQYIHDNTEDEFTHFTFINAYLRRTARAPSISTVSHAAKQQGVDKADRPAHESHAAHRRHELVDALPQPHQEPRLRRHLPAGDPGPDDGAVPGDSRNNDDTSPDHIQAIANTAGFHFATIEQGERASTPSSQRRDQSRGAADPAEHRPTETMHFQTWHGQGGQRAAAHRPDERPGVPGPERASVRRRGLPDQPDHARAHGLPHAALPGVLDHSPDRDRGSRDGRGGRS